MLSCGLLVKEGAVGDLPFGDPQITAPCSIIIVGLLGLYPHHESVSSAAMKSFISNQAKACSSAPGNILGEYTEIPPGYNLHNLHNQNPPKQEG
jgi:hypothetical protein